MANTTILTSDTNSQRQTKINQLTGGDICEFEAGTHRWTAGEFNTLIGSASGGSVVTYKPAASGVILYKDPLTKTEPFFKNSSDNTKCHNILIDGTVSAAANMIFDGAGISVKEGSVSPENWEIKFVKPKNFYIGANQATGRFLENTKSLPGLKVHDCVVGPANNGGREAFFVLLHVYGDMDNVLIYQNTCTDVWQPFQTVCHAGLSSAPTGFRFYKNEATGILRAFIEFLGNDASGNWFLNPMFYLNKASRWIQNTPAYKDTYGLSLVTNRAYGSQVFGNVIDGGKTTFADGAGVRIGFESSQYYSSDFANLINGCNTGYNNTGGGGGPYVFGNTISNNLTGTPGSPAPIKNDRLSAASPAGLPVYNTTRTADAGTDATATVTVSGGKVTALSLTNAGTNYKKTLDASAGSAAIPPKVTISGDGTGAKVFAYVNPATFVVEGFIIMNGGSGYSAATAAISRTATSEPNSTPAGSTTDYPIPSGGSAPAVTDEAVPQPTDGIFLSDISSQWMNSSEAVNAWGPFELDQSNGEQASGDGTTIKIGLTPRYNYTKGIGSHAPAVIPVNLIGMNALRFRAEVGVDNEVGQGNGSVIFEVHKDILGANPFWASTQRTCGDAPVPIDIDLTGWTKLYLRASSLGDNSFDHADWANARLIVSSNPGTTNRVVCVNVDLQNKTVTRLYEDQTQDTEETI